MYYKSGVAWEVYHCYRVVYSRLLGTPGPTCSTTTTSSPPCWWCLRWHARGAQPRDQTASSCRPSPPPSLCRTTQASLWNHTHSNLCLYRLLVCEWSYCLPGAVPAAGATGATVATGRNNRSSSDSCDGDTEDDRKNGNTRTRHKVKSDKRHLRRTQLLRLGF